MKKYGFYGLLCIGLSLSFQTFAESPNQSEFQNCLKELKPVAIKNGVRSENYDLYTQNLSLDLKVLEKLDPKVQPELSLSLTKYLGTLVATERVINGISMVNQYEEVLKKIEEKYGVPGNIVVAVWGVESNYGNNLGKYPIIQSLGTLSCFGRRQEFFKKEWIQALNILQEGHFSKEQFNGSWAGAFGQTQFMPSTFNNLAVDFDGDGKKDLFNSNVDSLASTANFLKEAGWKRNLTWGFEVIVPEEMKSLTFKRKEYQDVDYWKAKGVKLANGEELPSDMPPTGIILNNDFGANSFLVTKNFEPLRRYNSSEKYGLAIGRLAQFLTFSMPFSGK